MPADVPQDGAKPTPGIRVAAEYRWAHPDATWAEVATAAGCHRNTLERWRDTEAWEVAVRQAGAEHIDSLAPAAIAALRKSWARGNPAGAVDVLRALGLLNPPTVKVDLEREQADVEETRASVAWVLRLRQDHDVLLERYDELLRRHPEEGPTAS